MPGFPTYTDDVVQFLTKADLFSFTAAAQGELESCFVDGASHTGGVGELVIAQSRALSYLHAAEYSLLPVFLGNEVLRSPSGAMTVSEEYARLALLKGNCSLILWTHAPARDRIERLSGPDLTVFSGDASKLTRIRLEPGQGALDLNRLDEYSNALIAFHARTGWQPAVRIAESGALELQGLLWRLKNAVAENITPESFRESLYRLRASAEAARAAISAMAKPHIPEVGERFLGTVVKTTTFGAFVSLLPGRVGLLHITQIRKLHGGARIENVDDVMKVGDKVQVEIREIDDRGKLSLVPVDVVEREAAGEELSGHRQRDRERGQRRRV